MLKGGYCGTNDLIPGHCYYGAGVWRNTWVYLGRSSEKEFVWFFIGNDEDLLRNPTVQHILNKVTRLDYNACATTKSIKKVKPLDNIMSDKTDDGRYVSGSTLKIAESKLRIVDIHTLTQKDIDFVASKGRSFY